MRRILAALLVALTFTVGVGATQRAGAADLGAESDFANRVNGVRASVGVPGVALHPVLSAKAEAWAQHMADTGCLCHSNLPDGVTVGWRKLGENIGRGPNVTAIHGALVGSAPHYANMVDRAFHWIGVGVAYGGGQMYVAEVFMDGDPPPLNLLAVRAQAWSSWTGMGGSLVSGPSAASWVSGPSWVSAASWAGPGRPVRSLRRIARPQVVGRAELVVGMAVAAEPTVTVAREHSRCGLVGSEPRRRLRHRD